ncbi:MAG: FixH family protein [Oceanospirillaceae bacterium]|nr:FixH family protein [Oceanospirillaceae bacterium]
MSKENPAIAPWYKQPWLWFILAPLIAVFIYGFAFLYISIVTHDGIVKDDYYKQARGYHVDDTRQQYTRELGLEGDLKFDLLTGDVVVQLKGDLSPLPEFLTLGIIHPTHKNYDQTLTLRHQPGTPNYLGSLKGRILGKRYMTLTPADETWRLRAEISVGADQAKNSDAPVKATLSASE